MKISNQFKSIISETFYDKTVKLFDRIEVTDDAGFTRTGVSGTGEERDCNIWFDKLDKLREDYGIKEEIHVAITTESAIGLETIVEYLGNRYEVFREIPYDSHILALGRKLMIGE